MELVILNLFAEVNYSATANNVDRFLSKQLPRLLRRCGHDLIDLSSPKLSWAPSHSTGHNYAETSIVSALSIEQVIKAIYKSIYSCSELHKTVLIDNYTRGAS
jgi:phage transcriptional regulator, arpU family